MIEFNQINLKSALYAVCLISLHGTAFGQRHAVDYVNPFIGASTSIAAAGAYHGLGKTFPGAAFPFGMIQVSPNTITGGDNGSGYSYEHTSIEGFAFTQMSGVGWYGDLGNLLVMSTIGKLKTSAGKEELKASQKQPSPIKIAISEKLAFLGHLPILI
ncbi:hypothetical protein AGMMS49574_01140 [Bacteroidia bacterium]|nr:hypothetical protein AGMMS49574_01140 [Bacteroidia bacterium]